jgi:PST family polysaccharide transporter
VVLRATDATQAGARAVNTRKPSPYFDDNRSGAELGRQSLHSGAFSIASRAASVLVQLASTVILARLLSPEDFGLVAMVAAFTGFIPVLADLGTRDAAVQRATITESEVSALFWLTVAIGATLGILLAGSSSLIASFYGEPRLRDMAIASSVGFVVGAASCQHFALLRRAMQFREIALIEVGSNLLSSIAAILMAIAGAGYWALVAKPILLALFTLIGVGWSCRWMPGIPTLTPGVRAMIRFGLNVTGFTMTDYAGRSVDRVAIGYRSGSVALGFYQQALFFYENTLGLLAVSLHPVAVASLSKLTGNLAELKRSWSKAISTLAFYAMPAFAMLAVTAQDLISLVLGHKWDYTGLLVSVLALRGIPHVIERTLGWLHVPAGRADRWMRWGLIGIGVQVVALFCGLPFGVMGVVTAYVIAMYIIFIPAIAYAGKPLGIGVKDILRAIGAPLVGALTCAAVGFALRLYVLDGIAALGRILLLILIFGCTYWFIVVILFRTREPLDVPGRLVRDMMRTTSSKQ